MRASKNKYYKDMAKTGLREYFTELKEGKKPQKNKKEVVLFEVQKFRNANIESFGESINSINL